MGFTETVSACDQGYGFFIIHRHTSECITDIFCCCNRIRITIRPFRVYIDQAHLHRCQWFLQVAGMDIAICIIICRYDTVVFRYAV
ncbi:hypothetical protein D9M68_594700 [compost metagenome]